MQNKDNTIAIMLLFCTFLVLKLTHVIGWSWWWVTAPLWVDLAFWGSARAIAGLRLLFLKVL